MRQFRFVFVPFLLFAVGLFNSTMAMPSSSEVAESPEELFTSLQPRTSDGANWTHRTNWKSGEPLSTWFGVGVDMAGRVTVITLTNNSLAGTVPEDIGDLGHPGPFHATAMALIGQHGSQGLTVRFHLSSLQLNLFDDVSVTAIRRR